MSNETAITPDNVEQALTAALTAISSAQTTADLKSVRNTYLGESSALALFNREIGTLPKDQKAAAGKLVGQARGRANKEFAARLAVVEVAEAEAKLAAERVDMTAASELVATGARHPLAAIAQEVSQIFVGMGWEIEDGPEVENEWYNFDALNFDADHPARAMQDTFFVSPVERHLVMRTHTSPVQVRSLIKRDLPVYILAPGRVYRTDELDATHTPVFNQFEGLAVDKGLTMAHLRGTLEHFAVTMFGPDAKIRLRPSYFPFTEPSAELDVWYPNAKGGPKWIEWGGCGMINPNVLKSAGIDPDEYSGFAFGMGMERTLMFRNGVGDMHDMVESDVRFDQQLGGIR